MGRVLVTRRLPDGGLDPLAGHELVGPNADDTPYTHDELRRVRGRGRRDRVACSPTRSMPTCSPRARRAGACASSPTSRSATTTSTCGRRATHGIVVCNTPGRARRDDRRHSRSLLILAASRLAHDAEADLRDGPLEGLGDHAVPRPRRARRDARHRRLRPHRPGGRAPGRGLRHARAAPRRAPTRASPATSPTSTSCSRSPTSCRCTCRAATATHHLIDARRLALMKPTAVLVNTARGPVVDEDALADALHDGRLFAAGHRRVRARARRSHPRLLERAAHRAAPAHRLGVAGDPHPDGDAGDRPRSRRCSSGGTPPNVVPPT